MLRKNVAGLREMETIISSHPFPSPHVPWENYFTHYRPLVHRHDSPIECPRVSPCVETSKHEESKKKEEEEEKQEEVKTRKNKQIGS